ncbi:MAG: HPr family phosphocarrier protein [Planctomycetota bacterium]|nr:HPr family phosphocarrier protein [Gemmataceae bacterium]NBS89022.1 HPr family phosphocarrier protein [bacterium]NBT60300.1 HPr family phosphocarrier protein [Planctomycetia bacterium]RLS59203.1 MAG: HPr family phosphocarrier protein [Planctomycetota bacterium]MBJ7345289.1 HPr family phosphocarrier protein [Gemmataceae bacterium]
MEDPSPKILKRVVKIKNPNGFHMRPKAAFVEAAMRFASDVKLIWEGQAFNGKSMFELMLVAAAEDSEVTLEVFGSDSLLALQELEKVLAEEDASIPS